MTFFNQFTGEIEVNLRCRREADFNMLETDFDQHLEHLEFLLHVHWLKDRLVTVTQVGTHPDWRFVDFIVRPLTVW